MTLLLIGSGLIVLAGAIAALVAGVRGRKINDNPRCVKCSFDLIGVYPGINVCPECGADVTRNGTVKHGTHVRRPRLIAAGSVIMLISILIGSGAIYTGMTGFDWNTIKPVWLLVREAESGGPATADGAIKEIVRRIEDGELTGGGLRRALRAALDLQEDTSRPWEPLWGELLNHAIGKTLMTDAEVARYLEHVIVATARVRQRMRPHDPLTMEWETFTRGRPGASGYSYQWGGAPFVASIFPEPSVSVRITRLGGLIDGENPIGDGTGSATSYEMRRTSGQQPLGQSAGRTTVVDRLLSSDSNEGGPRPIALEPGHHTLTLYVGVRTSFGGSSRDIERFGDDLLSDRPWEEIQSGVHDGVVTSIQRIDLAFDVVENPADAYRAIEDPSMAKNVRTSFGQPRVSLQVDDQGAMVTLELDLDDEPPAQLAFDVYMRDGERWWGITQFTWEKLPADRQRGRMPPPYRFGRYERIDDNTGRTRNSAMASRTTHALFDLDAEFVDVVLLPSEDAAVRSIDVFEPWWGEIVIEKVPVTRRDSRTDPAD